ncbi:hypothetical protein CERSUDRAFT_152382 [Gelatoporia subvermispora B]|uniref:Protein kinase domain-containing protein n=1 Tax=Ceriporiopsis subvermispora (strain B) TaxID=914234 RepID=M2PRP0_CERS8|nr:hypothetical protein CERSUDRAFT_152382 [Gelatoporia subvermispora B]
MASMDVPDLTYHTRIYDALQSFLIFKPSLTYLASLCEAFELRQAASLSNSETDRIVQGPGTYEHVSRWCQDLHSWIVDNTNDDCLVVLLSAEDLKAGLEQIYVDCPSELRALERQTQEPTVFRFARVDLCETLDLLKSIVHSHEITKRLLELRRAEASRVIELLDNVLDATSSHDDVRQRCLDLLRRLCEKHGSFPRSCTIPMHRVKRTSEQPTGSGGNADVWKADYDGSEVALKVVRVYEHGDVTSNTLKNCLKEAVIWKHLRHRNITRFYGISIAQTQFSLVVQWMINGTISSFLEHHPSFDRLTLILDVAEGLKYLHDVDVIHGDLKGANILVNDQGIASITDFGLSSLYQENSRSTSSVGTQGSFRWMAPEILDPELFENEGGRARRESDVYSFALTMWEIFTGAIPFEDCPRDATVILRVIRGTRPQYPQQTIDGLNEYVWDIMEDCWQSDWRERPAIANVMERLHDAQRRHQSGSTLIVYSQPSQSVPDISEYDDLDDGFEGLPVVIALPPSPPPSLPSLCSQCRVVLDVIRYVCSTCGERTDLSSSGIITSDVGGPEEKGKAIDNADEHDCCTPSGDTQDRSSPAMSSWSIIPDSDVESGPKIRTGSNSRLVSSRRAILSSDPLLQPVSLSGGHGEKGFELCYNCVQSSVGVFHAIEMILAPGTFPEHLNMDSRQFISVYGRSAPKQKGQLRHAYFEQTYGPDGWQDVEQGELGAITCTTCSAAIYRRCYRCVSCDSFNLCLACYSQAHEIHPLHAFLAIPDKLIEALPEQLMPGSSELTTPYDEEDMTHPGVRCAHCYQAIVGARFHCAICESVDICSNCELAGLPGNIDSEDGDHNASHPLIKIPRPLGSVQLQNLSRSARSLWTGGHGTTSPAQTTNLGSLNRSARNTRTGDNRRISPAVASSGGDHGVACSACHELITGVRYQCACCPSQPDAFNLCAQCEERSYVVHDRMHAFLKFHRPVENPLQLKRAILPVVYRYPVGPKGAFDPEQPSEYLRDVYHPSTVCDVCMQRICGIWFRCGYCPRDLCAECEPLDKHNEAHVFLVFKSEVTSQFILQFNLNQSYAPALVPYPVYSH